MTIQPSRALTQLFGAGFPWPRADEEKLEELARYWRRAADRIEEAAEPAGRAARDITYHNEGAAIERFAEFYRRYENGANGHVYDVVEACRRLGDLLDRFADRVRETKRRINDKARETEHRLTVNRAVGAQGAVGVAADLLQDLTRDITEAVNDLTHQVREVVREVHTDAFAALDQVDESLIPQAVQTQSGGGTLVQWGLGAPPVDLHGNPVPGATSGLASQLLPVAGSDGLFYDPQTGQYWDAVTGKYLVQDRKTGQWLLTDGTPYPGEVPAVPPSAGPPVDTGGRPDDAPLNRDRLLETVQAGVTDTVGIGAGRSDGHHGGGGHLGGDSGRSSIIGALVTVPAQPAGGGGASGVSHISSELSGGVRPRGPELGSGGWSGGSPDLVSGPVGDDLSGPAGTAPGSGASPGGASPGGAAPGGGPAPGGGGAVPGRPGDASGARPGGATPPGYGGVLPGLGAPGVGAGGGTGGAVPRLPAGAGIPPMVIDPQQPGRSGVIGGRLPGEPPAGYVDAPHDHRDGPGTAPPVLVVPVHPVRSPGQRSGPGASPDDGPGTVAAAAEAVHGPAARPSQGPSGRGTLGYELPARPVVGDPAVALARACRDLADGMVGVATPHGVTTRGRRRDLGPVAGALQLASGAIRTGASRKITSLDAPAPVHSLVREVLDRVARQAAEAGRAVELGHGYCAEVVLLSEQLRLLSRAWRDEGEPGEFREYATRALAGARIATRQVGDTPIHRHGQFRAPCPSCRPVLDAFGVTAVGATAGTVSEHEPQLVGAARSGA